MRDGLTEMSITVIAVIVLVFMPMALSYAKAEITIEKEAENMICSTVAEVNCDGVLTLAEAEHIGRITDMQKYPMRLVYFSVEGIESGKMGDYIYKVNAEQLTYLLKEEGEISISEGGVLSVYR